MKGRTGSKAQDTQRQASRAIRVVGTGLERATPAFAAFPASHAFPLMTDYSLVMIPGRQSADFHGNTRVGDGSPVGAAAARSDHSVPAAGKRGKGKVRGEVYGRSVMDF